MEADLRDQDEPLAAVRAVGGSPSPLDRMFLLAAFHRLYAIVQHIAARGAVAYRRVRAPVIEVRAPIHMFHRPFSFDLAIDTRPSRGTAGDS